MAGAAALPGQGGDAGGQAEAKFGAGSVSVVLKSLLFLFIEQQIGVLQPPSSLPDYTFIVFLQNCHNKCSAVQCILK